YSGKSRPKTEYDYDKIETTDRGIKDYFMTSSFDEYGMEQSRVSKSKFVAALALGGAALYAAKKGYQQYQDKKMMQQIHEEGPLYPPDVKTQMNNGYGNDYNSQHHYGGQQDGYSQQPYAQDGYPQQQPYAQDGYPQQQPYAQEGYPQQQQQQQQQYRQDGNGYGYGQNNQVEGGQQNMYGQDQHGQNESFDRQYDGRPDEAHGEYDGDDYDGERGIGSTVFKKTEIDQYGNEVQRTSKVKSAVVAGGLLAAGLYAYKQYSKKQDKHHEDEAMMGFQSNHTMYNADEKPYQPPSSNYGGPYGGPPPPPSQPNYPH
ncbi:hypothetical protein GGF43_004431, partial [Coemansia sp. RSA 2618]